MTVDLLFTATFAAATLGAIIAITTMIVKLPEEYDARALFSNMLTTKVIALFYVSMLIPAFCFQQKGLHYSCLSTIALATVSALGMICLSRRARSILIQRHYL